MGSRVAGRNGRAPRGAWRHLAPPLLVGVVVVGLAACSSGSLREGANLMDGDPGGEAAGGVTPVEPGGQDGSSVPPVAAPPPAASPSPPPWRPRVGDAWQWQLSGDLDLSVDVPVYDIDWQVEREVVDELHRRGRRVICYVSVGTWESYRPDQDRFPEEILGRPLEDYADERWLDIRRIDLIGPLLLARFDACREKGFDAVEPDNVDAYTNDSGFPLTAEDQLAFNQWVAAAVRERGMAVGLKNDLDQVPALVDDFDFAVNEQCFAYDECEALRPFVDAGKAVLHVEYDVPLEQFCPVTTSLGFSSMLKRWELDAYRQACDRSG